MKKLFSLFALGALLFAACSENASEISGSTSVPNMGNDLIPQSPVLCSVLGVTDSLKAVEKGCVWSPEMWSRTSGYRVRTGFDNGTNTSGIWTWYTEDGIDNNAKFEWPGTAMAEYDSMALADVIDKCGGSLCGKVVSVPNEIKIDSGVTHTVSDGKPYVEFYFAGKDVFGNIEEVDVSAMQGICVEYSGSITVELIPNDSIAALNKFSSYSVWLPSVKNTDNDSLLKSMEACFSWNQFSLQTHKYPNQNTPITVLPPIEEVVAHLKGIRFYVYKDFNIISIGRYHLANAPTSNFHPVDETCVPIAVTMTFCECDYLDVDVVSYRAILILFHLLDMESQARDNSMSFSDLTKECLARTHESLIEQEQSTNSEKVAYSPCDNPLPEVFMCADGSESESQEFAKIHEESILKAESAGKATIAVADSLFNYCMSLTN